MALNTTLALTRRIFSSFFTIPRCIIQPLQMRGMKIEKTSDDSPWRKADKCKEESSQCPPRSEHIYETLKNNKEPTKQHYETCIAPAVKPFVPSPSPPPEPQPRRPRKPDAATTACANSTRNASAADANISDKCIKVLSELCPPVRQPIMCIKHKLPAECTRIAAPFASFHECTKPILFPLPMNECRCLERKPPCVPQLADR